MPAIFVWLWKKAQLFCSLTIYLAWNKQLAPKKRWWPGWKIWFSCGAGTEFQIRIWYVSGSVFSLSIPSMFGIFTYMNGWFYIFYGKYRITYQTWMLWLMETQRFFKEFSPSNDLTKIKRANTWELQICSVSLIKQLGPENYAIPKGNDGIPTIHFQGLR